MAPLWLRIIYFFVFTIIWCGITVPCLVWPRKTQEFAMRMLKDRRPHPLFGKPTPETVYADIIGTGIVGLIGTFVLIYVWVKLILEAWYAN